VARFHTTQKKYSFNQHRDVRDPQIRMSIDGNGDSSNYIRISRKPREPSRSGLAPAHIRTRKLLDMEAMRNRKLACMQFRSAASGLGRIPDKDLRAKILSRKAYDSKMMREQRNNRCPNMQTLDRTGNDMRKTRSRRDIRSLL
jgi:hypothetical protein